MKRLVKQMAAVETMSLPQLHDAWSAINDGVIPNLPIGLLRRLLAQHLQEKRYGCLPAVVARELARITAGEKPAAVEAIRTPSLSPGTRLIREWNDRTISVDVLQDGFLWEGRAYRSLSEIARTVTGAHWSGPRFFGLPSRG